jgi:hypothetical protein
MLHGPGSEALPFAYPAWCRLSARVATLERALKPCTLRQLTRAAALPPQSLLAGTATTYLGCWSRDVLTVRWPGAGHVAQGRGAVGARRGAPLL